ncbi:MAG TPA: GNAT family N-acetyltransferase [Candidatus Eremiobacteraceae bacterium]
MNDPPRFGAAIPDIESARLKLRGHRLDDLDDCIAMWSDPIVTRFIGGTPSTAQRTWMRLLGYAGHWSLMGFGYWAIEEKATGRFVGEVGFADFKRDIASSMQNVPELGWALAPRFHGKGFATEAVRAALAWGDVHLKSARSVCMISCENIQSNRVAEKCGYREFERTQFNGESTVFYAREKPGSKVDSAETS